MKISSEVLELSHEYNRADGPTEAFSVASTPKNGRTINYGGYDSILWKQNTASNKTTDNHQPNFVSIVKNKKTTATVLSHAYTVAELAAASGREKTTVCLQHRAGVRAAVKSA
jgi:hypothetical protein